MPGTELRGSPVSHLVREHRLVVVLRRIEPPSRLAALVSELAGAGARIFEITMDGAAGAASVATCRRSLPDRGAARCLVGAGTIRTRAQLDAAIGAGADFGVSPLLDGTILRRALDAGLPFVPGAYSPTEVDTAWRAGATFVKLFPASSLGPAHVRDLRGPLGEIEVIPTGGIDAANAAAFIDAGAVAVGVGSAIVAADHAGRRAILDAVRRQP